MSEEEELKGFKVSLDYADADGNLSVKDFNIKLSKPKYHQHVMISHTKYYNIFTLEFSLVLPNHIHEKLKGASVATAALYGAVNRDERKYEKDLSKTIKAQTLEVLTKNYTQMLYDYRWLLMVEKADLTKVIFYSFETGSKNKKSTWDGIDLGQSTKISYSYMVGYVAKVGDKEIRYNDIKKSINQYRGDKDIYENYKFVNWTSQREEFFTTIEQNFIKIIGQLNNFEQNLTEDKIELLMTSSHNLLGA